MAPKLDPAILVVGFIQAIATDPEAVTVSVTESAGNALLKVRVAHKDLGRVIGANGRTARALRILLAAMHHHGLPAYSLDLDADVR